MGITSRGTQSGFEAGSAIGCTDVVGDSTRWSTVPPIEPAIQAPRLDADGDVLDSDADLGLGGAEARDRGERPGDARPVDAGGHCSTNTAAKNPTIIL